MVIDYQNDKTILNRPHRLFDADGVEKCNMERRPQVIDTETGECICIVYCPCGKTLLNAERNELLKETVKYKPPLQVIDCLGNKVN